MPSVRIGTGVRRTSTRLADGRELIYFDEVGDTPRNNVGPSRPPPGRPRPQLRHDPFLDDWIMYAPNRPDAVAAEPGKCPLCPGTAGIPAADYDVVVVEEEQFLPLRETGSPALADWPGVLLQRPGHGRREVLAFSAQHETPFSALPPRRARTVLEAWADRTRELSGQGGIEQVVVFESRDAADGDQPGHPPGHPHGRIHGLPYVTSRTRAQLARARRHREATGRSLGADVLGAARSEGGRVVSAGEYWTAFVPHALRWPVEVHLYPHRQVPDLVTLTEDERSELAGLYPDLLRRLDRFYQGPLPYVAAWHQAPVTAGGQDAYLHLEVFSLQNKLGRRRHLAGSELVMGVIISDVSPDELAGRLRDLGD